MRRAPVWVIGLAAAVVALVAGGIFWAREWAVADPNLRIFAEQLVPDGGAITASEGSDCDATNGWDQWYRPQDTCHQVFWRLRGEDEARLQAALAQRATDDGWQVVQADDQQGSGRTIRLRRPGYLAFLSLMADADADRCVEGSKTQPDPAPELCAHSVMVIAE